MYKLCTLIMKMTTYFEFLNLKLSVIQNTYKTVNE